jgi:hypothetical protein
VDPAWLWDVAFELPDPSRPVSEIHLEPYAVLAPGELTGEISVPTITDDVAEPDEHIRMALRASGRPEVQDLGPVTGTVTDAN